MDISTKEILDYCTCPLLYQYKYINKYMHERTLIQKFEYDIRKIFFGFHSYPYNKQEFPPLKTFLKQWHNDWDKRVTSQEFISTISTLSKSDAYARTRGLYKKGIETIEQFYDNNNSYAGAPLLINKDYFINIGKHNLKGTLHLVKEVLDGNTKSLEIIHYRIATPQNILRRDVELTANSLAFRLLMGVSEQRIVEYDILSGQHFITKRNESDYKDLVKIINCIDKALHNKIFYPVLNYRCLQCPYNNKCKNGG